MTKIKDDFLAWGQKAGFVNDIPRVLLSLFEKEGLKDCSRTEYHSLRDEETRNRSKDIARVWIREAFEVLLPIMSTKNDQGEPRSKEDILRVVKEKLDTMEDWFKSGGFPGLPLVFVLGRKL